MSATNPSIAPAAAASSILSPVPLATGHRTITVALVGNPNTGKSTLFTGLAGVRQRTGNYPGVTVEKKIGHAEIAGQKFCFIDLPGTYSLAPKSPDEMVTVDVLLGRQADADPPDAILCIVDASNLERNLYLVSQVLEFGLPTVIALNMTDVAAERGIEIDTDRLAERLGAPVVPVQANRRIGLKELQTALQTAAGSSMNSSANSCAKSASVRNAKVDSALPPEFRAEARKLEAILADGAGSLSDNRWPHYLVERLLLDTSGYLESAVPTGIAAKVASELKAARQRLADAGHSTPAVEAIARYQWIGGILEGVLRRPEQSTESTTDRLDRILTHKLWGTLVFAAVMLVVFSSIFVFAKPLMDGIDGGVKGLADAVERMLPKGPLQSLVTKGIIGGAGSVIVFLPQILILFGFIAILEDCGYMARAAYLMDKLMVRVGLSGKSFIPLLSSFACAIPGVMATRVIENRRDRLTTILVAPLMSCSARLPVYMLLIGAFIPARTYLGGVLGLQGLTLFAMYLVGIVAAVIVAAILKKTLLRGATPPFVMELPPYKVPSLRIVLHRMVERGWAFIQRAGTLIVAVAVIVWAMLYYPHDADRVTADLQSQRTILQNKRDALAGGMSPVADSSEQKRTVPLAAGLADLDNQLARFDDKDELKKLESGAYQRQSLLGQMGRFVEPVVRPLGWDWRLGCAAIASFPAREVVLGTLGVIYNLGEDVNLDEEEGKTQLQTELRRATWENTDRPVFTIPVALSVMVFFALCAQCAATLAVTKRETNSWRWPAFTFVYMTVLAYIGAFATYQIGTWLTG